MLNKDPIIPERVPGKQILEFIEAFARRLDILSEGETLWQHFDKNFLEQLGGMHVSHAWRKILKNVVADPTQFDAMMDWSGLDTLFEEGRRGNEGEKFTEGKREAIEMFAEDVLGAPQFEKFVFELFDKEENMVPAYRYFAVILEALERKYKSDDASFVDAAANRLIGEAESMEEDEKINAALGKHSESEWRKKILDRIKATFENVRISKQWLVQASHFGKTTDPTFAGDADLIEAEVAQMLAVALREVSGLDTSKESRADRKRRAREHLHDLFAEAYTEFILLHPQP